MIFTYYVRKRKKPIGLYIAVAVSVLIVLSVAVVRYMNVKLDPIICDIADRQMANELVGIIASATAEIPHSGDFAQISRDSYGKMTSAVIDSTAINEYNSALLSAVSDKIDGIGSYDVAVSLANIFDDDVIFGAFPALRLTADVEPYASVTSRIVSSSQSAGINQTLYSVKLSLCAEVRSVLLISTITTTVNYEISLCELLLSGDVPGVYLGSAFDG